MIPDETRQALHVTFNMSSAGSLMAALDDLGRPEDAVGCPDDLSFGPINPPTATSRSQWLQNVLDNDDEGSDWGQFVEAFWSYIANSDCELVAWVNRRSAGEYANFLEFVFRMRSANLHLVDLTDVVFCWQDGRRAPAIGFGVVPPKMIVQASLYDLKRRLSKQESAEYCASWERLREENAPLRIVTESGMASAPLTYFDDMILRHVRADWLRSARVVGETLGAQLVGNYAQVGDFVVWSRLRALVKIGRIEGSGDLRDMRESFVRLPG